MYLSKLNIKGFRGINELAIDFHKDINIIIGENGSGKSAVTDAIRLLYSKGAQSDNFTIRNEDFHTSVSSDKGNFKNEQVEEIRIEYIFDDLSDLQKGAFYEYLVIDDDNEYVRVELIYQRRENRYPKFSYSTGNIEGQRADYETFELFQHYYLGALRDSTRDLLNTSGNILGNVIQRLITKAGTEEEIENIIKDANNELLGREEVNKTRENVNKNLSSIFKKFEDNKIGLQIQQAKAEYIVNAIRPYLPFDTITLQEDGFNLWQNSLGFNNLIYIATVLGDINDRIEDDERPHFSLLIEEPEAHLHPQLLLNLFNFLKGANTSKNSQLFITTHSPTLTSKVPLKNLILLDKMAYRINTAFKNRQIEELVENTRLQTKMSEADYETRKKQLERYIDVTRSQLFYAKSILFVEGITEKLLIQSFVQTLGFSLEDYRVEVVNVSGTSFYPFLYLFNSKNEKKKIPKKVAVLTDDDRFKKANRSNYSFNKLVADGFTLLDELLNEIESGTPNRRIQNLESITNGHENISINHSYQTLEYDLVFQNIGNNRTEIVNNFLVQFIFKGDEDKKRIVLQYIDNIDSESFNTEEKKKIALLIWKMMPKKAEFAQTFSIHLSENIGDDLVFTCPRYIRDAVENLIK